MPKTNQQIAIEVIQGKWGNGSERVSRLTEAGYDPSAVQAIVNVLVKDGIMPSENDTKIKLGTDTKEIDVDLSKYNSIKLNFHFG